MRKFLLSFVFIALVSLIGNAQNKIEKISMTYGEELPEDKQKIVKIIGEHNNKIYALGLKDKEDYFLKVFESASMKPISSNQIVIPQISDR